MINCIFDLFKLHRGENGYKMEIIREPLTENAIIDLDEADFNRLYKRFRHMKGSENENTIVYQENLFDDTRIHHELKQEYKNEFRSYYLF